MSAVLPSPLTHGSGWPFERIEGSSRAVDGPLPRISIVTPSFNKAAYVEQTIRSVLLQGYPNLEYFVMDGGSNDGTEKVIAHYGDQLDGWVSEADRGQSDAINKGWRRATGDVLAWVNADDMLAPDALWRVASAYERDPRAGIWHGRMDLIDADGRKLGSDGGPFELRRSIATTTNPIAQSSAFLSAHALKEVGLVDESLEMSMDWDLYVRVALSFDTVFVPEVWSLFRKTQDTKTRSVKSGFGFDKLKTLDKVFVQGAPSKELVTVRRRAYAQAHARCAVGYFRTKQFPAARKEFRRALAQHPASALQRTGSRMALRLILAGPVLKFLARSGKPD